MGYGNRGNSGFGGGNGGGGGFEPKPGQGTLFIKNDKRSQQAPDYDGYFIFDRDVRAGEKVKLVGWDKSGRTGNMITLKLGRDRQDAPGYNQGGGQGGYGGAPQQGYGNGPQNYGGQAPRGGYNAPDPRYNPGPGPGQQAYGNRGPAQGGYPPPQNNGYQQPPQGYAPPAAQALPLAPAQPGQPTYPAPPPEEDLPF